MIIRLANQNEPIRTVMVSENAKPGLGVSLKKIIIEINANQNSEKKKQMTIQIPLVRFCMYGIFSNLLIR